MSWSQTDGIGYQLVNEKRVDGEAAPSDTSFTYTANIGPGRHYLLEIRAKGPDNTFSEPAVILHTTPGNDGINLNSEANPAPRVSSVTGTTATITWPNIDGNFGYAVFVDRQYKSDSPNEQDLNTYTVTNLDPGSWYMFEVRTQMVDGTSERVPLLFETS